MFNVRNIVFAGICATLPACASSAYDVEAPVAMNPGTDCQGLDPDAGEGFLSADQIVASQPIYAYHGRPQFRRTMGAEVVVPATQGHSEAWLERVGRCQAASLAGQDSDHPLAVPGVDVKVHRAGPNFVVQLTGHSGDAGREIAERVERLRS